MRKFIPAHYECSICGETIGDSDEKCKMCGGSTGLPPERKMEGAPEIGVVMFLLTAILPWAIALGASAAIAWAIGV